MKTLLITVLLITVPQFLQAQDIPEPESPIETQPRGKNMISCSDYDAIHYNGYTVDQINETNGRDTAIQRLWGDYTSFSENSGARSRLFYYGNNFVGFNYEHEYLTGVIIKEDSWHIEVMNKELRVGDSFIEMQINFKQDLKVIYKPALGSEYTVSFNCKGNDYDGLHINFNANTHEIKEIIYFVNP